MAGRESLLFNAKLAEQAERFEEMIGYMDSVVKMGSELTPEERNLLSISYKSFMSAKRFAWRCVVAAADDAERKAAPEFACYSNFRKQLEEEMRQLAHQIIHYVDTYLLKDDLELESKAFYHKLKGDYFRYLAEIETGNDRRDCSEHSLGSYKDAFEIVSGIFPPTHPLRLGIALNFSVFYYEILNSADRACKLAKAAFDDAIAELDNISEENYKDTTLVMQLIRDNLTLWTTDMDTSTKDDPDRPVCQ